MRSSSDQVTLQRLQDGLVRLQEAALSTIRQEAHVRRPRKAGANPHDKSYPTWIFVLVQTLLGGDFLGDFIEQELSLDGAAVGATEEFLRTLESVDDQDKPAAVKNVTTNLLPERKLERKALHDGLKGLTAALEQCKSSYGALSEMQKRTAAKAMQQELWPQLQMICDDLGDAHKGMQGPLMCQRCNRIHEARIGFATLSGDARLYTLRVQAEHGDAWHSADLRILRSTASNRQAALVSFGCEIVSASPRRLIMIERGSHSQPYFANPGGNLVDQAGIEMWSLRRWINGEYTQPFSRVDQSIRAALALVLSYYYLHLSGTPLWPDAETFPDVWFEPLNTSGRIELHRPFLSLCYAPQRNGGVAAAAEGLNNAKRPSLPALGKLLLEIWLGQSLTWDEIQNLTTSSSITIDEIGRVYIAAVSRCWASNRIRSAGRLRDDQDMYDEYSSWVVKGLQHILQEIYLVRESDIFGAGHRALWSIDSVNSSTTSVDSAVVASTGGSKGSLQSRLGHSRDRNKSSLSSIDDTAAFDSDPEDKPELVPSKATKSDKYSASEMCLHEDGTSNPVDPRLKDAANTWMKHLKDMVHPFVKSLRRRAKGTERVKVAVLDTGAAFDDFVLREQYPGRIQEYRTWCDEDPSEFGQDLPQGEDLDGHGTQVASALLDVAPQCHVYVAKIFDKRMLRQSSLTHQLTQKRIAYAIKHATSTWKVDIITMSFGFDDRSTIIQDAIEDAARHKILLLAAASNYGALRRITFPATHRDVICVHAMTGFGHVCDSTPPPMEHLQNFATLGSTVRTWTLDGQETYTSGSSIATPIAAAIAALVIEVMRCSKADYLQTVQNDNDRLERETARYDRCLADLGTKIGMAAVFRMIVGETGKSQGHDFQGHGFLAPWRLLRKAESGLETTLIDNVILAVEQAV